MNHLRAAVAFDRDDPFVARRVATHARLGIQMHNYEKSRRLPAVVSEPLRADARICRRKLLQHCPRIVPAEIVGDDDFK